jgi:hypothetical protein
MITVIAGIAAAKAKRAKQKLAKIKQRQAERRRLAGTLKLWRAQEAEPEGDGLDLGRYCAAKLELVIVEDDRLDLIAPGSRPGEVVARLSGALIGASFNGEASERPEFKIEPAFGHKLVYESGGEMREASALTLCANDVLEMDGRWRMRFVNENLRTRAELESAQTGGI